MPRPVRLFIVDDEPDLRAMLVAMIDWRSGGFELAGQAIDGREALELLQSNPVDILITDLRMPVMSGLELLAEALPLYPRMRALVLSAWDEFNLVKSAFRLGASDYLLKSELTGAALDAALSRLRTELERNLPAAAQAPDDRQLHESMLRAMVQGGPGLSGAQAAGLAGARFMAGRGLITGLAGQEGALQAFRAELLERLEGVDGVVVLWISPRDLAVLLRFPQGTPWDAARRMPEDLHAGLVALAGTQGLRFSLGLSGLAEAAADPAGLHAQALAALEATFLKGRGRLIHAGSLVGYHGRPRLAADELAAGLSGLLDSGDAAGFSADRLDGFLVDPHCADIADVARLRELYKRYAFLLAMYARKRADPSLEGFKGLLDDFALEADGEGDLADCNRRLRAVFLELSTAGAGRSPMVRRALRHIHAHLEKPLDLSTIAAALAVNPSYLSRCFSREIGRPLTDYVAGVKIRRAAELLREGGLKVFEAAERLGYENPEHFSRVFKKVMGRSPREFAAGC